MKNNIIFIIIFLVFSSCKKESKEQEINLIDNQQEEELDSSTLATTVVNVDESTNFNSTFWNNIKSLLNTGYVDIVFAEGTYNLTSTFTLSNIGHDTNRLQLKAETIGSAVFTGSIKELMLLNNCKNILLHRLKFTGDVTEYALKVRNSKNITIAYCRFVDLPNIKYGALGVHYEGSDNVIIRQNHFTNVGFNSGAHMIYTCWGATRVKVINNQFTDCSGSYVRYRDRSTHGVVYGNNFTSTGTYWNSDLKKHVNRVFVEVAVFNKVNPGVEYLGTDFMVANNNFNYSTSGDQSERFSFLFHSSGYNPPGRNHLISIADASLLDTGTVAQRKAIMSSNLGLDADKIRYGNNMHTNVAINVSYRCRNDEGSTGPWTGVANITPAVSISDLAANYNEALIYYDDLY